MSRLPFAICIAAVLPLVPLRAEPTSLELILDCSASMWNKLDDGRYRIDGAKEEISGFLTKLPGGPDYHVGLRLYGSRVPFAKPGACEDSVLVQPIEGFARREMLAAVREAKAVGATPLARSLTLAAADFTLPGEHRVIICTDGEESCGGDVAAAVAALQAAGIDADVRIIGIGLTKEAAERFVALGVPVENVNSGKDLAAALGKAAGVTQPAAPVTAEFSLRVVKNGKPATGAVPALTGQDGKTVPVTGGNGGVYQGKARFGLYTATVGVRRFTGLAVMEGENEFVLDISEAPEVKVSVEPAAGALIGGNLTVMFSGSRGQPGEFVVVAPVGSPDHVEPAWAWAEERKAGSVAIRPHGEPGEYEARYIARVGRENVVAGRSAAFSLKLPDVSLKVAEPAVAGTTLSVTWTGPADPGDWIGWVEKGAEDGVWRTFGRPDKAETVLTMAGPSLAGEYEMRYGNDTRLAPLSRVAFTVVAGELSIVAADTAMAGTVLPVEWKGPKAPGIFLTVVMAGADDAGYGDYFRLESADSPAALQLPRTSGKAELRISSETDGKVLHRRALTLTELKAALDAPDTAAAGKVVTVKWSGPAGRNDFVTITAPDAAEALYTEYFYTSESPSPQELTVPAGPGVYELRYVADDKVIVRRKLTVQ